MGSSRLVSAFLILLNILHVAIVLGLTAASIWFYTEISAIASLRKPSKIAIDFNVYWPQALPWIFVLSAVLSLFVSCCGFIGAGKRIIGLVRVYITFEVISVLALGLAAGLALVYGNDPKHTDSYINDVFSSAFQNVQSGRDHDTGIVQAFEKIERRLYCCGSASPEDYTGRAAYPESCCDTVYEGCNALNSGITTQKLGCAVVAAAHAKFYLNVFAYVAIIAGVLGVANILVAFVLSRSLDKRCEKAGQDPETKKVLI